MFSKVGDAVVQALEGKTCVVEGKVACFSRLRDPGKMRGRKSENAMHNEWMGRGNAQESRQVSIVLTDWQR